jgi:hypothetical protein
MGQRATKSMMKQIVNFFAMLQSALELAQEVASAWLSPLELAACLHLASFDIHLSLHSVHCEPDHCWCSVLTEPSLHEMSTIAMALISLLLALLDWHVPPITCRILTAMCMHALRPERAWIAMALLLPTFGKRPQDQSSAHRKRSATTTSHATEQTGDNTTIPDTETNEQSMDAVTERVSPELDSNDATTASSHGIELLDDVIANFGPRQEEGEAFKTLYAHAQKLQNADQKQIREMCKPYGVALTAKKHGKWPKRLDADLKQDIQEKLIERARVLSTRPASAEHGDATERAGPEFDFEDAVADALRRINAVTQNLQIIARVVDHACHSQTCISNRVATMCREANWKTSADLDSDQPLDACGYIAADAVCRLRESALAEADSWHHLQLPDYSQLQCIQQGNNTLHKRSDDCILEAGEVNRLVRHYAHLDQRHQAAEEWWGGAIAIDHFLAGLPNSIRELSTIASDKQHRWRAWIVNTQTSRQQGSHWFTVVLGTQTQLLQSTAAHGTSDASASQLAMDPIASSSDAGTAASSSMKLPDRTAMPAIARASSPMEHASSTDSLNSFHNLFETPNAATTDMINWAHANAMRPPVAAWLRACGEWDSAVATKDHHRQQKRRKLCKDHDIPCTREIESNEKLDATMEYIRQELINRIQQIRTETIMSMHAIVVEFSVFSTDNARDLVKAAQAIITGKQENVRNLCKPWGVPLKAQNHYRSMATIKQELKTLLIKRAEKLKNEAEPYVGSAATEHAETEKMCDHRPSVSIQEGRFADIASFMRPMQP